jgi:phosphotransferase system  glucose/maltose/N-acetylglucosamine-specific IIC component
MSQTRAATSAIETVATLGPGTRVHGQWDAQFAVAVAGLVAAAAAVYLAATARPRQCALAATLAVVLGGGWVGWYSASPLHG